MPNLEFFQSTIEEEKENKKEETENKEGQVEIPAEFKEYPPYLKKRFEVVKAGYKLNFSTLSELLEKDPSLARPDLLFLLSYKYQQLKEKGEEFPALDKKTLKSITQGLSIQDGAKIHLHAAKFLTNLGETQIALWILKRSIEAYDSTVRVKAAQVMANLGKSALETLKKLTEDEVSFVRMEAAKSLAKLGETQPAMETLKGLAELTGDENRTVRAKAAQVMANLGKSALEISKELVEDKDPVVRGEAAKARIKTRFKKLDKELLLHSLVFRQEPLFANPVFGKEMQEQLLKLSDIVENLQKRYPNLVGLSVLGSFSKGYYLPGTSDIDWGLIYRTKKSVDNKVMIREFKDKAKKAGFNLCRDHLIDLSQIKTTKSVNLEIAFNGLFVGKRNELIQAQKRILQEINKQKWQEIQEVWKRTLENYSKAMRRFNLTESEFLFVEHIRNYLWQLPDYKTMSMMNIMMRYKRTLSESV